jgi:hypothetical protein
MRSPLPPLIGAVASRQQHEGSGIPFRELMPEHRRGPIDASDEAHYDRAVEPPMTERRSPNGAEVEGMAWDRAHVEAVPVEQIAKGEFERARSCSRQAGAHDLKHERPTMTVAVARPASGT